MKTFIARGRVRETGVILEERITAPNAKKAADMAQNWAHENALFYMGIEDLANPDPPRQS